MCLAFLCFAMHHVAMQGKNQASANGQRAPCRRYGVKRPGIQPHASWNSFTCISDESFLCLFRFFWLKTTWHQPRIRWIGFALPGCERVMSLMSLCHSSSLEAFTLGNTTYDVTVPLMIQPLRWVEVKMAKPTTHKPFMAI